MNHLMQSIYENTIFLAEFFLIVVIIFLIAYLFERYIGKVGKILTTQKLSIIGLFSAISFILMLFEISLPFAPAFYKIDISEAPVLIISLAYGPVAGVLTEFCKILLKLLIRSTSTAFVGELANFIIGCSLILPASFLYMIRRTKKIAISGVVLGTVIMTMFGSLFNAIYLLPTFSKMYGMPLDQIVAMGTSLNPMIDSISTLVLFCVVPFNVIKGVLVSGITIGLYKKLSVILKST